MKIKKTNVFRLELEKENCTCRVSREYGDIKYAAPLEEPVFTACEKHAANAEVTEFAKDLMIECLATEALSAGKQATYAPLRQDGGTGGVLANAGETVQAMGVTNLPKRPKQDPTVVKTLSVDRSDSRFPTSRGTTGNLNIASEEDGITITGDIETVAENAQLSGLVALGLGGIEEELDEADMRDAGLSRSMFTQAKD
jgi:hypothetical protein